MGYSIWDILIYYFIDLLKLLLVMSGMLNYSLQKNKYRYVIMGLSVFAFLSITKVIDKSGELSIDILSLLVIITLLVILQGKLLRKLYTILLAYICILFLDTCVTGVISLLGRSSFHTIINSKVLYSFGNGFSILIISTIVLIKKFRWKSVGKAGVSKRLYAILFASAGTGILFISSLMIVNAPESSSRFQSNMFAITIIICLAYFVASLLLVILAESRDNYRTLSKVNQTLLEAQQNYYLLAQEKQQEIRGIRHEINNHLTCIYGLYRSDKLEQMGSYINQLIEQLNSLPELLDTGNDIVNTILNEAVGKYDALGIKIQVEGSFPEQLLISQMDLCVIFANAISNAIEAIAKIDSDPENHKVIQIRIRSHHDDLFIDISNPVAEKVTITNGILSTTKKDKYLHGFGTKNMKQSVEKYLGTVTYENVDQMFTVHIAMKNR